MEVNLTTMKKAKVKVRSLNILRDVTVPEYCSEIIATLNEGDTIMVDDSFIYWNWTDVKYYKTSLNDGYANIDGLEIITT